MESRTEEAAKLCWRHRESNRVAQLMTQLSARLKLPPELPPDFSD
jgi:hypothetical protein